MQYASTYSPSISKDADGLADLAYEAGVEWFLSGNKVVPMSCQVNGQWIHPRRGHGASVDFRNGFRSAKNGGAA
jgi:hypothetical protein